MPNVLKKLLRVKLTLDKVAILCYNMATLNRKRKQNEYRQENKNSSFIADFGFTNGFKSTEVNERKNINHFFAQFKKKI